MLKSFSVKDQHSPLVLDLSIEHYNSTYRHFPDLLKQNFKKQTYK